MKTPRTPRPAVPTPTPQTGTGPVAAPSPAPAATPAAAPSPVPTPTATAPRNQFTRSMDWISKNWLKLGFILLIGAFILAGVGSALGISAIPLTVWWAILSVALVVGGQFLVRSSKFQYKYVGWTLTIIGGLAGLVCLLLIGLDIIEALNPESSEVANSADSDESTPPSVVDRLITFLLTIEAIWWQLGLALLGIVAGEALSKLAKFTLTGRLLSLGALAFGAYVLARAIPEETWAWFTPTQFSRIWQQIQTWNLLGIWETIVNPNTPLGMIAVVVFIPVVLIGTIWVKPYRWVIGAIALVLTVGAIGYVVYRDAVPVEVKVGVASIATSVGNNIKSPSVPQTTTLGHRRVELVNGGTYELTNSEWLVLDIPTHRCIAVQPSAGFDAKRMGDNYYLRSFGTHLVVRAYILKEGGSLGSYTCS